LQYAERYGKLAPEAMKNVSTKLLPKLKSFFRSWTHTRLNEEQIGEDTSEKLKRFTERNVAYGENGKVTAAVARQILESCL
jgi:NADP-dependent alcohol dehydrogenase